MSGHNSVQTDRGNIIRRYGNYAYTYDQDGKNFENIWKPMNLNN